MKGNPRKLVTEHEFNPYRCEGLLPGDELD